MERSNRRRETRLSFLALHYPISALLSSQVARGKVDMGFGGFWATDISRWEVVHFANFPYFMHFHFCAPSPQPVDPYLNILKPYDVYGWMLIAAALAVVSAIGAGINGLNPKGGRPLPAANVAVENPLE